MINFLSVHWCVKLPLIQQLNVPQRAVEKQHYEMPELVGFQTMVILDPNGMTFDAVGVFGLAFQLLFKSGSTHCVFTACFTKNRI